MHVLGMMLFLFMVLSSPMAQDYPANSEEWTQAFDAIEGGASVEDAVMPAPAPNRLAMAEFRAIWESVAATAWTQDVFYNLEWSVAPQVGDSVAGVLSDGTAVTFDVTEAFDILDAEALSQLSQDQIADIAERQMVGWVVSGVLSSATGETTFDAYYVEFVHDTVLSKLFFPLMRADSSGPDVPRGHSGPQCACATCEPALAACLDRAKREFRRCRRDAGVIFVAGLLGAPFTGGGTAVGGGVLAMGAVVVCRLRLADNEEDCLDVHTAEWWVEDGYVAWRPR